MTSRTIVPRVSGQGRGLRALAALGAAATLALLGAIIGASPLESQALGSAGSAVAWGLNGEGQLGNGTTTSSKVPVPVTLVPPTTITAIAGGGNHSLGLASNGKVLAWGRNQFGQLGTGDTLPSRTPVPVSLSPLVTVTAISAGNVHSLALTSSGLVLAWGYNGTGQLGNNSTTDSNIPVTVSLPAGITAIAAGAGHSLALTSDGKVWAWGSNTSGELGNGTNTESHFPVPVSLPPGITVTALAAGGGHSLALTSTGRVLSWGWNAYGQLGNGTIVSSNIPVLVNLLPDIFVTAIAGGGLHSLALTASGRVWTWGYDIDGELGDGSNVNSSTPVGISLTLPIAFTAIAGGGSHSLAVTSTGQVMAWGLGSDGQLGNNSLGASNIPVAVSGPSGTSVTAIAGGGSHSLALPGLVRRVVLPALANSAYGGYTTVLYGKNNSPVTANVSVKYFDAAGTPVGTGDSAVVPVNGGFSFRQDSGHAFASGGAGVGVIFSDQPVSAFVNEFASGGLGDATSYTGVPIVTASGTPLAAPTIANNAYGGYTTGIGLVNLGVTPADITIIYRNGDGTAASTQVLAAVPAGAYRGVYSGAVGLPDGFAGSALISTAIGSPIAAIVNETGPGGQFSSYDTVPGGVTSLFAPTMLRNAFGGYNTGLALAETSGNPGLVTIVYTDSAGTSTTFPNIPIAARGFLGIYQGNGLYAPLASGNYTARISASGGARLAAIVNEVAAGGTQSTSYNTFFGGSLVLNLPLVESNGPNYLTTGVGIMNTSALDTATVTLRYFDPVTGTPIGTNRVVTLLPGATAAIYHGDPANGLPGGASATATVTTVGGAIVVICNEVGAGVFMSYVGG